MPHRKLPTPIATWRPGDLWDVSYDDCTGEARTEAQMDAFMEELNAVANKYDFKTRAWGGHRATLKGALVELGVILDSHWLFSDLDAQGLVTFEDDPDGK